MKEAQKTQRSKLAPSDARRRYIEIGERVVLEQIREDAERFNDRAIAIGPFARLDAAVVAASDDKTRGAITNLFGSQLVFQAETMALALSAGDWIEQIKFPAPADYPTAEAWVDAFLVSQSERGPVHGATPTVNYAFLWALWLSAVPYGLWSEQISRPAMEEHAQLIRRLEGLFEQVLEHFHMKMRGGATTEDLACAVASQIEGVWLNQCLTKRHPCDPRQPISTVLRRAGRLLWLGATEPA
jgi:hypothetical protein